MSEPFAEVPVEANATSEELADTRSPLERSIDERQYLVSLKGDEVQFLVDLMMQHAGPWSHDDQESLNNRTMGKLLEAESQRSKDQFLLWSNVHSRKRIDTLTRMLKRAVQQKKELEK